MNKIRYIFIAILLSLLPAQICAQSINTAAVLDLEGQHPSEYFTRATALFQQGQKDDAVFVYYVAQLRYRTYVTARPDLPQDQDPALLSSLMATIGPSINQYAFGDLPRVIKTLDAVLAYGSKYPDTLTPRQKYPQAHKSVLNGLMKLKSHVQANSKSIREERVANGLVNRN